MPDLFLWLFGGLVALMLLVVVLSVVVGGFRVNRGRRRIRGSGDGTDMGETFR